MYRFSFFFILFLLISIARCGIDYTVIMNIIKQYLVKDNLLHTVNACIDVYVCVRDCLYERVCVYINLAKCLDNQKSLVNLPEMQTSQTCRRCRCCTFMIMKQCMIVFYMIFSHVQHTVHINHHLLYKNRSKIIINIHVSKNLKQGCCMASTLFKLYLNRVLRAWTYECNEMGIPIDDKTLYIKAFVAMSRLIICKILISPPPVTCNSYYSKSKFLFTCKAINLIRIRGQLKY